MNFLDRPFDFIGSERTMKDETMYANPITHYRSKWDGHHYIVPACVLVVVAVIVMCAMGVIV